MRRSLIPCLVLAACLNLNAARAEPSQALLVQLNAAEDAGDACRLTFVIRNQLPTAVASFALELVMFDRSEGVSGYAAVDFGAMPAGKTIVRQYDVGNAPCNDISRVLLNEVRACDIGNPVEQTCLDLFQLSSRTEIDFIF